MIITVADYWPYYPKVEGSGPATAEARGENGNRNNNFRNIFHLTFLHFNNLQIKQQSSATR
jgi:hypothetical protein